MLVHFFAAARAAAGASTLEVPAEVLAQSDTLGDLLAYLGENISGSTAAGMSFAEVLSQCSFLLDGVASEPTAPLVNAARLDVLPPFAGG